MSNVKHKKGKSNGPDFIGIGAARSGTTWLSSQLSKFPEVWMPKRKELHYFSRNTEYLSPSYLHDSNPFKRLTGLESRNLLYKKKLITALGASLFRKDFERLSWEMRYLFGDSSLEWYKSLFPNDERISGEITPAYALLSEESVAEIVSMNPNIKIIFILRNPIERAWSTIKYHAKRGQKHLMGLDDTNIVEYLSQPNIVERSNYLKVIDLWGKYIHQDQFLLLFYDDIIDKPTQVTESVANFLGLDGYHDVIKKIKNSGKVNSSFDKEMPSFVRKRLGEIYSNNLKELSNRVGGVATNWERNLEFYM